MIKNPFATNNRQSSEPSDKTEQIVEMPLVDKPIKTTSQSPNLDGITQPIDKVETTVKKIDGRHQPAFKGRPAKRDVSQELSDEAYQERLSELNNDAENKHYVLFFGTPASGKTWIIGSLLHYMKDYLDGMVYLDSNLSTTNEEELFYQLQDRFNGVLRSEKITSTDTTQYFELNINFTPKDKARPPMNIIFIDASGEHSEQGAYNRHNQGSGKLPNYLTAILESRVNTKLAFVYDQSLDDRQSPLPQLNVLNSVFAHIQQIQKSQKKVFPKVLLLSKADLIEAHDRARLERTNFDAAKYAIDKIPGFANSFLNESMDNRCILYSMGTFSVASDTLLEFNKDCPERFFRWLYVQGTGVTPVKEKCWWQRFISWLKGE